MGILLAFISIQDLAVELRCVKTQARYVYSSILIHICGPMDNYERGQIFERWAAKWLLVA